ncbi:MAG: DUF4345 domain-containing protein [Actinomycetota bacterium]
MKLVRWFLRIGGAVFLVFGLLYAVSPETLTDPSGFGPLAPEALTDLRATYGGLQLGIGAFLIWAAYDAARHHAGLMLLAVTISAVAASRAFGLIVDGEATAGMVGALTFEVALSVAALILLRKASSDC